MNRARVKELLPVFQAFANGEIVQFRDKREPNPQWVDSTRNGGLAFMDSCDYRVKKEPRKFVLAVSKRDGSACTMHFRDDYPSEKWEHIEVVEVLPSEDS